MICDIRSSDGVEEKEFDAGLDFQVIRIPRKRLLLFSYLQRLKSAFSLASNSDIIIASGKFPLWSGALLSFFCRKKFVAVIHGSELLLPSKLLRQLTYISLKRYDLVVAVSRFTQSLIQHLRLRDLQVIYNGFNINSFRGAKRKEQKDPVLVTVGNVTRRKGQHNLIKALPTLLKKYPDLKYHIVGIPSEKEKLQKLSVDLKVEKAVIFHGRVSETEKEDILQNSDIFVMLSESTDAGDVEGFGIAILEANALGIPAIGALGCGIEEAVAQNFSGLLVNKSNPLAILNSIETIMKQYDDYSNNARSWAKRFTWDKVVQRYIEILQPL